MLFIADLLLFSLYRPGSLIQSGLCPSFTSLICQLPALTSFYFFYFLNLYFDKYGTVPNTFTKLTTKEENLNQKIEKLTLN